MWVAVPVDVGVLVGLGVAVGVGVAVDVAVAIGVGVPTSAIKKIGSVLAADLPKEAPLAANAP